MILDQIAGHVFTEQIDGKSSLIEMHSMEDQRDVLIDGLR